MNRNFILAVILIFHFLAGDSNCYELDSLALRYHYLFPTSTDFSETTLNGTNAGIDFMPEYGLGLSYIKAGEKLNWIVIADYYRYSGKLTFEPETIFFDISEKEQKEFSRFSGKIQTDFGNNLFFFGIFYKKQEYPFIITSYAPFDAEPLRLDEFGQLEIDIFGIACSVAGQKIYNNGTFWNLGAAIDVGAAFLDIPEPFRFNSNVTVEGMEEYAGGSLFGNIGWELDMVNWTFGVVFGVMGTLETLSLGLEEEDVEENGRIYSFDHSSIPLSEALISIFIRF